MNFVYDISSCFVLFSRRSFSLALPSYLQIDFFMDVCNFLLKKKEFWLKDFREKG